MSFFNTDGYAIERYEGILPDMLFDAQQAHEKGKLDEKEYANTLRKIYALLEMLPIGEEDK